MADQNFRVKKGLEVGIGGSIITTNNIGNVGIGTTNPTSKLYVVGDGYYTGVVTATTFNGGLNKDVTAGNGLTGGGTLSSNITLNVGAGSGISVNADDIQLKNAGSLTNNYILKWDGSNTQLTSSNIIDTGTNIGIGITNPSSILSVGSQTLGTNTDNRIVLAGRFAGGIGTFASFYFKNSQDTGGSSASIRALRVGDNYGTELAFFTQVFGGDSGGDGVEAVRINSIGNVGIATTNPGQPLDVNGNVSLNGALYLYNTSKQGLGIWYNSGIGTTNQLTARLGGQDRLTIDSSGNLGLGATPGWKLDVYNATDSIIRSRASGNTSAGFLASTDNGTNNWFFGSRKDSTGGTAGTDRFNLLYNANSLLAVDTSGNFGLGVTPSVSYGKEFSISADLTSGVGGLGVRNLAANNHLVYLANNVKNTGAFTDAFWTSAPASKYAQNQGVHYWYTASSGTAGATISFNQAMTLDVNGNLGINTTYINTKLTVVGIQTTDTILTSTLGPALISNSTNNVDTTALQTVLSLQRFGKTGSSYNSQVNFNIGRYSQSGAGGNTQLTLRLANGNTNDPDTDVMSLWANGNVGIGTINPGGNRLRVNKDLGTNDYFNVAQHSSQFQIGRVSDNKSLEFAVLDNGTSVIQSKEVGVGYNNLSVQPNANLLINTLAATGTAYQALQVNSGAYFNGNVGIGITNPNTKLHIASGNIQMDWGAYRIISNYDNNYRQGLSYDATNRQLRIFSTTNDTGGTIGFYTRNGAGASDTDYGSERVRIDNLGNLGINTTSPLQRLHTVGNFLLAADGTTANHITQKPYTINNGTLSWEGSAGQLFSITNNLTSGSIFSVNDVSGIPSIDVNADGTVLIAPYNGNVGVGTLVPTSKLHVSGNIAATGQFVSTQANSTTTGGGQIYLNGATGNRIDFNTNGIAAPAFTTRSAGTKIVLYPSIGASAVDFAIGIDTNTLWYSVQDTSQQFRWYGGTTNIATLSGGGNLTLNGTLTAAGGSITGTMDFTGGSAAVPAVRVKSGGSSWSEGLAIHPSADNGYALTFFRTRSSLTDNTNTWALGNLGDGGTNNFGLLRSGLTGGSGIRVDSIFDVTQAGVFRFGFTPTVGSNTILHAGNSTSYASGSVSLTSATISSSAWAGTAGYHGYTYTGGNYRFGFSSTAGVVDVYADGNFYANEGSSLVLHTGNYSGYASFTTAGLFNKNNPAISNGSYNQANASLELRTTDASNPVLGFHRSGYTAVALYHNANSSLRLRDTITGGDYTMLHSGNAAIPWTPIFTGGVLPSTATPGTFTKSSGSANAWDGQVYSSEGYITNVFVSCSAAQTTGFIMVGLNADPTTDASYTGIDYCWFFDIGANLQIYENGSSVYTGGSYTTSDILSIVYDGSHITYYKNNTVVRQVARAISGKLYLDSSFYNTSVSLTNLTFGTYSPSSGTIFSSAAQLPIASDSLTYNGIAYTNSITTLFGQTDGALHAQAYNTNWVHQIYGDYRTGQIAVRGRNSGTWQSWRAILDATNYTSYVTTITAGADQAIVNQDNGTSSAWRGRILSKNSTADKAAFLGTYGTIAGVFAHNNALNAWADLYVNTINGNDGGTTYINNARINSLGVGAAASGTAGVITANADSTFNGVTVGRGLGSVSYNTAVGYQALAANTSGGYNTATGYQTLYYNTTGQYNTANGYRALLQNTTGQYNTAIGYLASYSNTIGTNNTAIGYFALSNNSASNNTANGYSALRNNTTGNSNIAIGTLALSSNTIGTSNIAVGYGALYLNTNGLYNTAIGYQTLYSTTNTTNNTGTGYVALSYNTTGGNNTANGAYALQSNTTGSNNTATGVGALQFNTIANNNTAAGYSALCFNTTGVNNTAVGNQALYSNTTGTNNTAIGNGAGYNANTNPNTTGSNNTFLGNNAVNTAGGSTASNTIVLGNSSVTTLRCNTATISALSDARDKKDIQEIPLGLAFLNELRPVRFTWNQRDGGRVDIQDSGFIAQEALEVVEKYDADWFGLVDHQNPEHFEMSNSKLIPVLVKAIQELSQQVQSLQEQITQKT